MSSHWSAERHELVVGAAGWDAVRDIAARRRPAATGRRQLHECGFLAALSTGETPARRMVDVLARVDWTMALSYSGRTAELTTGDRHTVLTLPPDDRGHVRVLTMPDSLVLSALGRLVDLRPAPEGVPVDGGPGRVDREWTLSRVWYGPDRSESRAEIRVLDTETGWWRRRDAPPHRLPPEPVTSTDIWAAMAGMVAGHDGHSAWPQDYGPEAGTPSL